MLRKWVRGSGPAIIITDSGALMGDVVRSSRGPLLTSLLWAIHRDGAQLVLPRHVIEEVEGRLQRRVTQTDDLDLAFCRLHTLYLPYATVIDEVPDHWASDDPRVLALAARDPSDLPAAQLAVALGCAYLFAEDPDLCDSPGLGVNEWLPIAHAAANDAEVTMASVGVGLPLTVTTESVRAAWRGVSKTQREVQLAILGVMILLAFWFFASGRGRRTYEASRPIAKSLLDALGPPFEEIAERRTVGREVFARTVIAPSQDRCLGEVIANVLVAESSIEEPMLREPQGANAGRAGRTARLPQHLRRGHERPIHARPAVRVLASRPRTSRGA
ncbi:MAG: hypothetical protein M0Z88_02690 [Actinomycetota bacterium]|jgi:hypothetical protein|nr:hypothetical protein [Actinomycetota bacterium]